MHKSLIGMVGASGYAGMELTRILSGHAGVSVRFATSDRWVGATVGQHVQVGGELAALKYVAQKDALELSKGCAAVLLATPAEASLELAPKLLAQGVKVVDLSGAFRLRNAESYGTWYGFSHHAPELLGSAVYGLTELFRGRVCEAKLVANPGCYPTAATLPLAPLLRAGLVETQMLVINAASGVTGAGRKATEDFSFSELDGDFRAYRVLRHQHTPEIRQTLEELGRAFAPVTFTPHLLPVKRGILCTTHAFLTPGTTEKHVRDALAAAYADEPFVELAANADAVSLKRVVGTNRCQIGLATDGGRLVLVSAIDNLLKGAAGQAVQNLNLLLGLDETEGLQTLKGFH